MSAKPDMLDLCDDLTHLCHAIDVLYAAVDSQEASQDGLTWLTDRVSDMAKDAKAKANAIRTNGASAGEAQS